jgi:hypothetical protein
MTTTICNEKNICENLKSRLVEGVGSSIKKAAKYVKRGFQGWDKSGGIEPKEIVKRNKEYDDATVTNLRNALKGDGKKTSHSPGDLQQRVLDREAKKRGMEVKLENALRLWKCEGGE